MYYAWIYTRKRHYNIYSWTDRLGMDFSQTCASLSQWRIKLIFMEIYNFYWEKTSKKNPKQKKNKNKNKKTKKKKKKKKNKQKTKQNIQNKQNNFMYEISHILYTFVRISNFGCFHLRKPFHNCSIFLLSMISSSIFRY